MDMTQREYIINTLRMQGHRLTKQRRVILEVILENDCDTCKEIYNKVYLKDPTVGLSTVYRMVSMLENLGALYHKRQYQISTDKIQKDIAYHDIIECIASALDAKDPYTQAHSKRVSEMTEKVCHFLGVSEEETEKIHIAAHVHDIGKIGIPDIILNKSGKLNKSEWEKIKQHPQIGATILRKSEKLREISDIVLNHHERFDGRGYPNGIVGEYIPLGARIIAICDSIDAMCVKRSYRNAFSSEQCYDEIRQNLGKMYDPFIGRAVLNHWSEIISST